MRERLYLFDTTLRDGAQTNGVDFTLADKLAIAAHARRARHRLCRGRLSGRQPDRHAASSPSRACCNATFTAFGMTRRPGRSASNDPGLAALLDAKADAICFVAKSWDYHVRVALETTLEENLASIRDSVQRRQGQGPRGAARLRAFLRRLQGQSGLCAGLRQGRLRGGRALGRAVRHQWRHAAARGRGDRRARWCKHIPGDHVGIHAHNDTEQAVANSLAAVRAGARQIQGTLNGLGERCGNANLVSIIPTLKLKPEFADSFEIGVSRRAARRRSPTSRTRSTSMLNRAPNRHAPYVGESAFATKAGIHASAIVKDPATYEHVAPEAVGNRAQAPGLRPGRPLQRAGRARAHRAQGRQERSARRAPARRGQGARGDRLCLRGGGRLVRAAGAAHARHACRNISTSSYFDVKVEQRINATGERVTVTEAVVKVKVGDETLISAAEGNGPVNALDVALRKDLGKYQKLHRGARSSPTIACVSSTAAPRR